MRLINYTNGMTSPWTELERMLDSNLRNFPFGVLNRGMGQGSNGLPVDIYESATERIFRVEMPGVSKEEVGVELEKDILKIQIKRSEGDGDNRTQTELSRSIRVGQDLEADSIKAKLEDGILTITVSKSDRARKQLITIE